MKFNTGPSWALACACAFLCASAWGANPVSIQPYGKLSDLLTKDSPWRVFRSDDPVLTSIRADRLLFTGEEDCAMWVRSLAEESRGIRSFEGDGLPKDLNGWTPISQGEMDAITGCDGFPCAMKMNKDEAQSMISAPKSGRLAAFLAIVGNRAREYEKTGKRSSYEFPGGISEPWSLLDARGLRTDLPRPAHATLGLRTLNFHESRVRPIRQLVDHRVAVSPDGKEASVWIRDVYTDHYFDSWGEWANLRCFPEKRYVEVVFALSLELDLLKKHDILSLLARGSMRNSVRELSIRYLDDWSHSVQSRTEKLAASARKGSAVYSRSKRPKIKSTPADAP